MPASAQGSIFLVTVAIGGMVGFLYDIYRVLRVRANLRGGLGSLGDLIYWALACATIFALLLKVNQGELRLYVLIGLSCGAIAYFILISRIAFRFVDFIWYLLGKMEKVLFTLLECMGRTLYSPVRGTFIVLMWPLKSSLAGGRHLGSVARGGIKRRGGGFLFDLGVKIKGYAHFIHPKKRD